MIHFLLTDFRNVWNVCLLLHLCLFAWLISYRLLSRVVLTVWGVVTLICGAFIFGQSTTIAVMQLLGKI